MELEIVSSVWSLVFTVGAFGGILLAALIVIGAGRWGAGPFLLAILGIVIALSSTVGSLVITNQINNQNDDAFKTQLANEYNATSDRSLGSIRKDFEKYNEAMTKFTRDGSETTVFIKKISDNDGKLVMAFSVLDEKSLYPKANK